MVVSFSAILCLLIVAALVVELRASTPDKIVLSPFWYFSFLFVIAFPIRAVILNLDLARTQVYQRIPSSIMFPEPYLTWAVVLSGVLWLTVLLGRRATAGVGGQDRYRQTRRSPSATRPALAFLAFTVIAVGAIFVLKAGFSNPFGGREYQKARMATGALWILPEFFIWASIAFTAIWGADRAKRLRWWEYTLFGSVFLLSVWISGELHTRRLLSAVALLYVVIAILRNPRFWPLGIVGIFATVFSSPILEFLRTAYFIISTGQPFDTASFLDAIFLKTDRYGAPLGYSVSKVLYLLSGTFEGAGHLAELLFHATTMELLTGVDHGMSWLFNAGLGLVPRSLWTDKPLVYGGMAQFNWMYPRLFKEGFAASSVPMSFAVDFAYGFGLPVAFAIAYGFGRILGIVERTLLRVSADPAQLALALFIYVFMFNWVRGGTIIVQSVVLFSIPLMAIFGIRATLHAVLGVAGEAVGLVGAVGKTVSRIYFYPHAYMRARQLDTIRHWRGLPAINAGLADNRTVGNVTRDRALAKFGRSWKSILPLINIKRRPKEVPDDGAVYVWGGLVNKGAFIADIDNPYAFTGYNVFAAKFYKGVIQSFLLSDRCLEIRCMSRACLDNLRIAYGADVADKAVVSYPYIAAQPAAVKPAVTSRCKFLFVSTQFEIKGGAALLKAFARVVSDCPGAELDLVTHLPQRYEDVVAGMSNVRVHDAHLSRDEIGQRFIADADVLVHPTYMDSFGMVVLEAISYGLPVIATDVYALREMVEDGQNGLVLPPPVSSWSGLRPSPFFSDVQKLSDAVQAMDTSAFEKVLGDAMIKMVKDVDFRNQAAAHSRELVRTRFMRSQ